MKGLFASLILMSAFATLAVAQGLPLGKWRLEEYRFANRSERPLKGVATTLVIKAEGKLGGDSGCNAYGGSYSTENEKLAITDIISTVRACEEPTPQFEKNFFNTLESAVSAKVKGDLLVLKDKDGHYLRFSRVDR